MGALTIIFTTVVGLLLAAFAGQLTSEFRDWTPRWTEWLIDRAVRKLPIDEQDRFAEEWREFVSDTPGQISKLVRAFGLGRAARRMGADHAPPLWRALGLALLVFETPMFVMIIGCAIVRGGPIFVKVGGEYQFRRTGDSLSQILTETSLYRLPALWNVVRGDAVLKGDLLYEGVHSLIARLRSIMFGE
jgi:hypothetical protein